MLHSGCINCCDNCGSFLVHGQECSETSNDIIAQSLSAFAKNINGTKRVVTLLLAGLYSSINKVQVQTKQIQVVEVSKHTQTTKYAPRDSTFSFVMLSLTSPKLGLMKNFDPFLKKSDMNANERSGSCDSKRPFFYLPGLHCRGSFEMLAVIPASNEWCRIGSCCLSMFEL